MRGKSWWIGVGTTTRTDPAARSDTTFRLPCIIPMASPARHRDRAGKIQLPAVQGWGAVQNLHIRLDLQRRHQPRFMPLLKPEAPDVIRSAASFHRNDARRRRVKKAQQPMPLETFAKRDRSRLIQPGKTANALAQINAQNLSAHQMLLSPPMPATIAVGWRESSSSH